MQAKELIFVLAQFRVKKYWTRVNSVEFIAFMTKLTIIIPGLLFNKQRLARSTDYHAKLRPLQAAEVAARRKADEDKKLAAQAAKEAKAKLEKEQKELKAKEEQEKGTSA